MCLGVCFVCVCVCVLCLSVCVCAGIPQGCCLRHDFNFILACQPSVSATAIASVCVCVSLSPSLSFLLSLLLSLLLLSLPFSAFRKLLICSVMWQHYLLDCFILRKRCLWFDTMHAHRHAHTHTGTLLHAHTIRTHIYSYKF